jgi:hypothetical protein
MRKIRFFGLPFIAMGTLFAVAVGFVTMVLWNVLMPVIFGLPAIGFGQALGLLILGRLLFGRVGGWGSRARKSRFVHGWKDLTPEERERFRGAMGARCAERFGESGASGEA